MSKAIGALKTEFVDAKQVAQDYLACPACGGKHVLIEGAYKYQFSEEYEGNQLRSSDVSMDVCKNIESVVCPHCKVRFVILPSDQAEDVPVCDFAVQPVASLIM